MKKKLSISNKIHTSSTLRFSSNKCLDSPSGNIIYFPSGDTIYFSSGDKIYYPSAKTIYSSSVSTLDFGPHQKLIFSPNGLLCHSFNKTENIELEEDMNQLSLKTKEKKFETFSDNRQYDINSITYPQFKYKGIKKTIPPKSSFPKDKKIIKKTIPPKSTKELQTILTKKIKNLITKKEIEKKFYILPLINFYYKNQLTNCLIDEDDINICIEALEKEKFIHLAHMICGFRLRVLELGTHFFKKLSNIYPEPLDNKFKKFDKQILSKKAHQHFLLINFNNPNFRSCFFELLDDLLYCKFDLFLNKIQSKDLFHNPFTLKDITPIKSQIYDSDNDYLFLKKQHTTIVNA